MMNQNFRSYRDLDVWKKSLELAKEIYKTTNGFPAEEKFGLVNQMQRAAVSIPSNIAEGHARLATGEFMRFVSISLGSVAELETQLILSKELHFISKPIQDKLLLLLDEIGKMLLGLYKSLQKKKLEARN